DVEPAFHPAEDRIRSEDDPPGSVLKGEDERAPVFYVHPTGADPVPFFLLKCSGPGQVADLCDDRARPDGPAIAPDALLSLQVEHASRGVHGESEQRPPARIPPLLRVR